jgi:phosphatidylglycerol:prolipoprotein diacylglycerol transferase
MPGPFVHSIDPILLGVGGLYLWWYGLSYSLGFLGVALYLRRHRERLGLSTDDVFLLGTLLAGGVLLGGRLVEVFFYEWSYYSRHLLHIPAVWLGGMSTHGILLGAVLGVWLYCRRTGRGFLDVADALAIPGAYVMGVGRIGNFIDGQIVGALTEVPWAVQFPDAEGFRHPVVLYDGLKNLLLIPLLVALRNRGPAHGVLLGTFLLGYGLPRVAIDFFREYRNTLWGFPPGQELNLLMSLPGLALVVRGRLRPGLLAAGKPPTLLSSSRVPYRALFAALVLLPTIIPSDWTQDVPWRYGRRHPGLEHSILYPELPELRTSSDTAASAMIYRARRARTACQ